jgi:hypothetical protein
MEQCYLTAGKSPQWRLGQHPFQLPGRSHRDVGRSVGNGSRPAESPLPGSGRSRLRHAQGQKTDAVDGRTGWLRDIAHGGGERDEAVGTLAYCSTAQT